jgi:uncharacterized membrane protein (DUF485 family)
MANRSSKARAEIERLGAARWRIAIALTAAMMVIYFGFILLVAFNKPLLGRQIAPGMSIGILLGALVIVTAWGLIGVYTRWANRHYDAEVARLRETNPFDSARGRRA